MERAIWRDQLSVCLVILAMLPSLTWASPKGNANVSQIMRGSTFDGPQGSTGRVVLTTDPITFEAFLWDSNAACAGVAPTFVQVFVFTPEGELEASFDASSSPQQPSQYRLLFLNLNPGALPVGTHKWTFLVRSCDNTRSFVLPEFLTIRVVAP